MPRLIPAQRGNGRRPSDPLFESSAGATVVVLDVSEKTHELVGARHSAALDPEDDTGLLAGHVVLLDNPEPRDGQSGAVIVHVGGSTLHEAATEVIACYEQFGAGMPEWVASTDEELAAVVAEHFTVKGYSTCKVRSVEDVAA